MSAILLPQGQGVWSWLDPQQQRVPTACISFRLHVQWHHTGSWKLATIRAFISQKLANKKPGLFAFQRHWLNIYQCTTAWGVLLIIETSGGGHPWPWSRGCNGPLSSVELNKSSRSPGKDSGDTRICHTERSSSCWRTRHRRALLPPAETQVRGVR